MDNAADVLRDGATVVHDRLTLDQLASIEGASLAAPAGQHDDRAMAHMPGAGGAAVLLSGQR